MTTTTRRNRGGADRGRDMAALLSDFGHDLPTIPALAPEAKEPRLFKYAPRRGAARRGRGWAAATAPAQAWRMTSDQAPVFWPFVSAPALPPTGAQMGVDQLSGGSFYCDPFGWVLRDDVPATNPNIFQFAKPGTGQVRHHQGVLHPDDALRLPDPGPGRPQGRVRVAVPRARCRAVRDRPRPARPDQPAGHGPARPRLGEALGRGGPAARGDHLQAVAGPGPRPGRQHEDRRRAPGAVRPRPRATSSATPWRSSPATPPATRSCSETTIPQLWDLLRNPTEELVAGVRLREHPPVPRRDPAAARRARPAGHRHPGRPVRRPHQHRGRLARPDPVAQPLPARRPRR